VRHVLFEALAALSFGAAYATFGFGPALLAALIALSLLFFLVLYDIRHTIVPMAPALAFILFSLATAILSTTSLHAFGLTLLVAGIIGLFFFILFAASRGRAMGLGDAPLSLGLALLAGPAAFSGLLFSFWIGAAYGIVVLVSAPRGHRMGIEVPFVPFLAIGFLLALFTGWNPLYFVS
jgi:prepilin signal peptidase PulO-like enzyme (type II secretory pathway)